MVRRLALPLVAAVMIAACGGETSEDSSNPSPVATSATAEPAGLVTVDPNEAAATIGEAPDGLVVLDVRTPAEYDEGHIENATLIDFYEPDFADRIAELDRDVPYVLYCRSGNRSGQALDLMSELGFESVQDVDGGIIAWTDAGLPTVSN